MLRNKHVAIAVEGVDTKLVLMWHLSVPPDFRDAKAEFAHVGLYDFKDWRGYEETQGDPFRRWLQLIKIQPDYSRLAALGVIRDAEFNAEGMEQSIRAAFTHASLPSPHNSGMWRNDVENTPATGYLLLPVNGSEGCLEHSLLDGLQDDLKDLQSCAEEFADCAQRIFQTRNPNAKILNWRAKVITRAIMAGSDRPSIYFGDTSRQHFWDFEKPALRPILDFLRQASVFAVAKNRPARL